MIKVVLWDIDGTLLDFKIAEKTAFCQCFEKFGLQGFTDEMLARYSVINHEYWEKLERNEITKEQVLVGRYVTFFTRENELSTKGKSTLQLPDKTDIAALAKMFNDEYQLRLGDTAVFCPYAEELVHTLKGNVKQYIVTNGTATAQHRKLKTSGLDKIMDGWFISDEIGYEKPNQEFFDAVWNEIGHYEKNEVIIIGDSLTSDIRGGNQAGILTCWYNPDKKEHLLNEEVNYEVTSLQELYSILELKE